MDLTERKSKIARNCGKNNLAVKTKTGDKTTIALINLRCKSWLCPVCSRKKARRFSAATSAFFTGQKVSLLTLTVDRRHGLYKSWQSINPAWNRFRTALVRRLGKTSFVRVIEPQPRSGFPHFHVLINRFLPPTWLANTLKSSGFGRIFDIKRIDGKGAFFYVRKYLRKSWPHPQATEIAYNLGIRRISGSRGFSLAQSSKVSWSVLGMVRGKNPVHSFGAFFKIAFPSPIFSLIETAASDGWLSLTVRDITPRAGPVFSVFGLTAPEFQPFD